MPRRPFTVRGYRSFTPYFNQQGGLVVPEYIGRPDRRAPSRPRNPFPPIDRADILQSKRQQFRWIDEFDTLPEYRVHAKALLENMYNFVPNKVVTLEKQDIESLVEPFLSRSSLDMIRTKLQLTQSHVNILDRLFGSDQYNVGDRFARAFSHIG